MAVAPSRLQGITAYELKSGQLKTLFGIGHAWFHDIPQHIRFPAAGSTGASATEELEIEIRFLAIIPLDRKFISDLLNVSRFKAHRDCKFTTT